MEFLPLTLTLIAVAVVAIIVGVILVINHLEEPLRSQSKKSGLQRVDDYTFGTTSILDMSTGKPFRGRNGPASARQPRSMEYPIAPFVGGVTTKAAMPFRRTIGSILLL